MEGDNRGGRGREAPGRAAVILSLGLYLTFSSLGGLLLGSYLDKSRGTSCFTPIGLILGLLAGFHRAYVLVKVSMRRQ